MITRDEIVRSLTGAWEIFLDRPDAMSRFDVSVEGFWRSFQAILLVIPSYLVVAFAERSLLLTMATENTVPLGDEGFFAAKAVALAVDWVALPLVMAVAAGPFGIADRYVAFVVARNWAAVLIMLPYAAIAILFGLGFFGTSLASFLSLAVLIVALRMQFQVARRSLEVPVAFAIAVVVFDFVLSLTIGLTIDALFGISA